MAGQQKRLALDTNVLIDLGQGADFAHDFRETFQRRGYALRVPPTAVVELTFLSEDEADVAHMGAFEALARLREWGISAFDLTGVEHGFSEQFANRLIERGIIPDGEFNDGAILAETALGAC